MVTSLNRSHRTLASTALANNEIELVDVISLQNRVRRTAIVTGDVHADVLLQNGFKLLACVFALDDELVLSVERTVRTQLTQDEAKHMFVIAIHLVAVIHKIDPASLGGSDTSHMRSRHHVFLAISKFGVFLLDLLVNAVEDLEMIALPQCYLEILVILVVFSFIFQSVSILSSGHSLFRFLFIREAEQVFGLLERFRLLFGRDVEFGLRLGGLLLLLSLLFLSSRGSSSGCGHRKESKIVGFAQTKRRQFLEFQIYLIYLD